MTEDKNIINLLFKLIFFNKFVELDIRKISNHEKSSVKIYGAIFFLTKIENEDNIYFEI
jgi:hypothetical protein